MPLSGAPIIPALPRHHVPSSPKSEVSDSLESEKSSSTSVDSRMTSRFSQVSSTPYVPLEVSILFILC